MKRLLAAWVVCLALIAAPLLYTEQALGQAGGVTPGMQGAPQQLPTQTLPMPVVSSCGAGTVISQGGNDTFFRVVMGAAGTACTITHPGGRINQPVCMMVSETTGTTVLIISANTVSTLTWTWTGSVQATWDVTCWGQ